MSYIIIIVLVILVRTFIVTLVRVDGTSMNPTLVDGQFLLLNKTKSHYDYMDIVVFDYKNDKLIKRVIGKPGDKVDIKDNSIYINGEKIEDYGSKVLTANFSLEELGYDVIPSGYYFVLGDNRYNSTDSRIIGLVNEKDINGNIIFSLFPFSRMGVVH